MTSEEKTNYCINCENYDRNKSYCKLLEKKTTYKDTCNQYTLANDPNNQKNKIIPFTLPEYEKIQRQITPSLEQIRDQYKTDLLLKKPGEATELLVKYIKSQEHIYTTRQDERQEMWIYKEGTYIPQGKSYIREHIRTILTDIYTEKRAEEVISRIEVDTYISPEEFFQNKNIHHICVMNGILNIKTLELEPFDPEKIYFNKIPVNYNPEKKCPAIIKFFEDILKTKDDLPVMQELFGYLLYKRYEIEKAFMFLGTGRNGKSKTIGIMKRFIGDYNCSSVTLSQFQKDQYSHAELFNKMANLAGDISNEAILDASYLKAMTGRDSITANRKYLSSITFVNYAKFIFSANDLPKTYDTSTAFWDRWVLLEFPYTFKSQKEINALPENERTNVKLMDPNIVEHITSDEEMSGLLNWALEGLHRLLKQRDFSYTKSSAQVKELWLRKSNSFQAFLADDIVQDTDRLIEKGELRKAYAEYCLKHKIKVLSDVTIKNSLGAIGISEVYKRVSGFESDRVYAWEGIKFKSEDLSQLSQVSQGFSIHTRENVSTGLIEKVCDTSSTLRQQAQNTNSPQEIKEATFVSFDDLQAILLENPNGYPIYQAVKFGFSDEQIKQWIGEGLLFESPAGTLRLI